MNAPYVRNRLARPNVIHITPSGCDVVSSPRLGLTLGAKPLKGDYAGLHIKDPDGINVQIIRAGGEGAG